MKVKFYNTTNGVFISAETAEFVLNVKKPYKSKEAALKAMERMIYRLFYEPEKFLTATQLVSLEGSG